MKGRAARVLKWLIISGLTLIFLLSILAWLAWDRVPPFIESKIFESFGLHAKIDGLDVGTRLSARSIVITIPDDNEPVLILRGVAIEPAWLTFLGDAYTLNRISIQDLEFSYSESVAAWARNRPVSKGEPIQWALHDFSCQHVLIRAGGHSAEGEVTIQGLRPDAIKALHLDMNADSLVAAKCRLGDIVIKGGTLSTGMIKASASGPDIRLLAQIDSALGERIEGLTLPDGPLSGSWLLTTEGRYEAAPGAASSELHPLWGTPMEFLDRIRDLRAEISLRDGAGETRVLATIAKRDTSPSIHLAAFLRKGAEGDLQAEVQAQDLAVTGRMLTQDPRLPFRDVSLKLKFDLRKDLEVLPGSAVTISRINFGGHALDPVSVVFSGNFEKGFGISTKGSVLGAWDGRAEPRARRLSLKGEGGIPDMFGISGLKLNGELTAHFPERGDLSASWKGSSSGAFRNPDISCRFGLDLDATLVGRTGDAVLKNVHVTGRQDKTDWEFRSPEIRAKGDPSRLVATLSPSRIKYEPYTIDLSGGVAIDGDDIRSRDLQVAGVPLRISAQRRKGRIGDVEISWDTITPMAVLPYLPPPAAQFVRHSRIDAGVSGDLAYRSGGKSPGTLKGEIRLSVAFLRDSATGVEIRNLNASLPVDLPVLNPRDQKNAPKLDMPKKEERYPPDQPFNFSALKISKDHAAAENLRGRIVFTKYVVRLYDVAFDMLDRRGSAGFWIDPLRDPKGRFRILVEARLADFELRKVYESLKGKGEASATLKGRCDFYLGTSWSDTECQNFTGFVKTDNPGVLSTPVFKALIDMMPPERKPPDIALALIGDYHFDHFKITLQRDTQRQDIFAYLHFEPRTNPRGASQTTGYPTGVTPWVEDINFGLPVLTLVQGLPTETKIEFTKRRKGKSESVATDAACALCAKRGQ